MLKRKALPTLALIFLVLSFQSCAAPIEVSPPRQARGAERVTVEGIIHHVDLEGGFFVLETEQGETYDLIGLPPEQQQDGLWARITGLIDPETVTSHMRGTPLQVQRVKLLDVESGQ